MGLLKSIIYFPVCLIVTFCTEQRKRFTGNFLTLFQIEMRTVLHICYNYQHTIHVFPQVMASGVYAKLQSPLQVFICTHGFGNDTKYVTYRYP